MFKLLDLIIQDIGKNNVTHVITDYVYAYVFDNHMLEKYKKISWNCKCINMKNIGDFNS